MEFNSLEYRKKRFEKIFSNEKSNNYIGLINFNKLDAEIYKKLQDQCLDFIIASFDPKIKKINLPQDNDEKLMIEDLKAHWAVKEMLTTIRL